MTHDLPALKTRLTIPELWLRLGLPGTPGRCCRSPFRADRTPSFSIHDQGRRWKDFGTGEGGDAIDFLATACAVDNAEATRRFLAMAGVELPVFASHSTSHYPTVSSGTGGLCLLPPLHRGTPEEVAAAARSRGLAPAALSLAQDLGTLRFGTVCGHDCWVLCDPSRRIAEARRMDRQPFPAIGTLGARKAHTLRGSAKSWPLGTGVLERRPHVRALMLVEGGPDYLAALHFCLEREVHDVLPIAMLGRGTGARIHPEALA
ncbi:MAG: primase, partial [Verrucomicrobiaceae bacterium]|nr:primase [Verrucomicrobiaceae bacterium]